MISPHFNLLEDTIPIGGVQRHISNITRELGSRGNLIKWCYKNDVMIELSKFSPDIIIAHDFVSFVPGLSIPQIIVFHGYEGNVPPLQHIIDVRLNIELQANRSICVGEFLKKWYGHQPDVVLWGGVNETNYVEPPKQKKLLYLGRLDPDQSPRMVFEAFKKLSREYSIDVCGNGRFENEIKFLADKYKLNITFHGFVKNPDEYIKQSDIVICSGYLTILESYINKRPVISVWGNELKKDYLELMPCPPILARDSISLSAKINKIYKEGSPDIEKNYEFAKSNTWKTVIDKYEELFKCILK